MSRRPGHLGEDLLPPEAPPFRSPVPPHPGDTRPARKGAESFDGSRVAGGCLQCLQSGRGGVPPARRRVIIAPGGFVGRMRFLVVLLGVMVAAGPVFAPAARAADDAVEKARTHFREGEKHYNLGEFEDALREFKDSYRLKNDPVLLYNIGQCQLKLGDDRAALHSFGRYLRLAPNPPNRKVAEEKIAQIEQRLKVGPGLTPAASAEADPRKPAPVFTEGRPPVAVAAGSTRAAAVPALADPFAGTSRQPAAEIEARPLYRRWWVWAVAAGVVAGAVTTLVIANRGGGGPDCLGVSPCGTLP